MAPDASSTLVAPSAASKRPAAEQLSALPQPQVHDEAARGKSQQQQQQLECPRCHDTNTKFCYYNNYSTAQPRHFCRACRRYWTHGGTLRDVPVGGATRHRSKRRRLSSHEPSSPKPHATTQDDAPPPPDLISTSFPFLSDGSYYLPQLDGLGGLFAPAAAFTWPSTMVTDFYGELAPPWDDGTVGGVTAGAWSDIVAGLDLSWPPPPSY